MKTGSDLPINARGYWETSDASGHVFDQILAHSLFEYCSKKKIRALYDFGCGMADYQRFLQSRGITSIAFDGNPHTPQLTGGRGQVLDLSKPVNLERKLACVLSLEVGEHIPREYESSFIDNIICHTKKYVILSWAIPGQIGDGHVNCRSNDYIISQLDVRGFNFLREDSEFLRKGSSTTWFANTIMVFKKRFSFHQFYAGFLR